MSQLIMDPMEPPGLTYLGELLLGHLDDVIAKGGRQLLPCFHHGPLTNTCQEHERGRVRWREEGREGGREMRWGKASTGVSGYVACRPFEATYGSYPPILQTWSRICIIQ